MRLDSIPKQFRLFFVFCLGMLAVQVHAQQSALLIANSGAGNIGRYHGVSGDYEGEFVAPGSGGLGSGCLTAPTAVTTGPDGHFYVGSGGVFDFVARYDGQTGASIDTFVFFSSGGLNEPSGLTFGPDGNLYVSSKDTDQVLRYDGTTGAFIDAFVATGSGGLDEPFGLTFGPDGNLYVCSVLTETIIRYDGTTGAFIDVFVDNTVIDFFENIAVVFGPDGNLYTTSAHPGKVVRFDGTTGAPIDTFVNAGAGGLADPISIRFGPDGNLYALDFAENNVFRFDGTTGAFIDIFVPAGSGGLQCPFDFIFATLPPPAVVPPTLPAAVEHQTRKNRYVTINPTTNGAVEVAYAVELVSMKRCTGDLERSCVDDNDCDSGATGPCTEHPDVGSTWWLQPPQEEPLGCLPGPCGVTDQFARVDGAPNFQVWDSPMVHIGDCEIVPVATYEIRACLPPDGTVCSIPLTTGTIMQPFISPGFRGNYGDVAGQVVGTEFMPPDGFTNVADVSAYQQTAQNYGTANTPRAHPTWVDLNGLGPGQPPQYILNIADLGQILRAIQGDTWTKDPGNLNPGQCL